MKKLLNARRVRERSDICERTLHRWERQPDLGFPRALVANRRKYFNEDELDDWERRRARLSVAADSTPAPSSSDPRGPPAEC